jgi:hypothetical protein
MNSPPRPYCLPGCDRLDDHDGRNTGACMKDGRVIYPRAPGCGRLDEHECGPTACAGSFEPVTPVASRPAMRVLPWARAEADWAALGACNRQPSVNDRFSSPCGTCRHSWYLHLGSDFCIGCQVRIMGRELMSRQVHPSWADPLARPPEPTVAVAADPARFRLVIEIPGPGGAELRHQLEGIIERMDRVSSPGGGDWLKISILDREITARIVTTR